VPSVHSAEVEGGVGINVLTRALAQDRGDGVMIGQGGPRGCPGRIRPTWLIVWPGGGAGGGGGAGAGASSEGARARFPANPDDGFAPICIHGRQRYLCAPCGGAGMCAHGSAGTAKRGAATYR
jgi:hypothetical protein